MEYNKRCKSRLLSILDGSEILVCDLHEAYPHEFHWDGLNRARWKDDFNDSSIARVLAIPKKDAHLELPLPFEAVKVSLEAA